MTRQDNILWQEHNQTSLGAGQMPMTDRQDTNAAPFTALYRRHVQRIYAYCYRRTGNHADAEDLTEQVFAEALEKYDGYREQGKASAWLFTIAHSRVVDHYRGQRPQVSFDEAFDPPAAAPGPER